MARLGDDGCPVGSSDQDKGNQLIIASLELVGFSIPEILLRKGLLLTWMCFCSLFFYGFSWCLLI